MVFKKIFLDSEVVHPDGVFRRTFEDALAWPRLLLCCYIIAEFQHKKQMQTIKAI